MNGSVQDLEDKDGKLKDNSENPSYSTNWCNLPTEMRLKCIETMDFVTRTRLGATSHLDKSVVAFKKYKFEWVRLFSNYSRPREVVSVSATRDSLFDFVHLQTVNNHEKTLNCLVKILKNCEIDTFEFSEQDKPSELQDFWPEIEKSAPFRFKTFKLTGYASKGALFFLKNCEGVENIVLNSKKTRNFKISDFMDLPVIIKAKLVQFQFHHVSDRGVHQLIQKWIDNQSEIGKSLQIVTGFVRYANLFASAFEDRVICKTDDEVRIRTNDESKHILMRFDKKIRSRSFFSCTIIPSNLLEAEYEKDVQ